MKLIPRFSLRFAGIAPTIFLIVFGVGASYWRAYQEHERVAFKLETLGFDVEEEYDTLFGWVIGKRITGLQGNRVAYSDEITATLGDIPKKYAVRKLSIRTAIHDEEFVLEGKQIDPARQQELLRAIGQLTSLETLDLSLPGIAPGQLQELATLHQLRSFNLNESNLPAGELRSLLEQLPNLERVQIEAAADWSNAAIEDVLHAKMPNLRQFWLSAKSLPSPLSDPTKYPSPTERRIRLDLTRQGIGHCPKLEYLILDDIQFRQVALEAGSMPQMKILDLSGAEKDATVEWEVLPRAAPSLKGMAIHKTQLTKSVVTMLSQYATLLKVHLAGMERRDPRVLQQQWQFQPEMIDPSVISYELLNDLLARCERLEFPLELFELWRMTPKENIRMNWPSWEIKQYRTKPKTSGGGLF